MTTPVTDDTQNNDIDTGSERFSREIPIQVPERSALEHLAEQTGLSRQKIRRAMTNGSVWLESAHGIQRIRRAKKILSVTDTLYIYYDESIQQMTPAAAELVADTGEYSIWNKPSGMYSQGTRWGDHCSIYRWAETHLQPQRPAFLVHRLDRAANGLILLAHTKKMATALSGLFADRKISKRYRAKVKGPVDLSLPLTITQDIDDKQAISHIIDARLEDDGDTTLTVDIETGRKHQIRRHLASIGHPVMGDRLYGIAEEDRQPDDDLQLQSYYLKFTCPASGIEREYELDC